MTRPWWQRGVIYHVYPRSFADADGDGVGDLRGIAGRLDHLAWLGVDAVWLSPIYQSPMRDNGYDISDHTAIDPLFGSLDDFDALVARAHRLGVRVILDYVPNHTSDEHPWFREKPDWYLWRDAPNNWVSVFGGSPWELDAATGRYYYHAYLRSQPDLNWRNPEVRAAMLDVLRFWLDRGVDGFRVDALRQLVKDPAFPDNPPNPDYEPGQPEYETLLPLYSADQEDVVEPIAAMRDVIGDRLMTAELWMPLARTMRYYGAGVDLPSNMHLFSTPWTAEAIAALAEDYEALLPPGAWPNWVLSNHDRSRIASRVGAAQARVAAMLLLTLRGTPTLYYGDELGMADVPVPPGGDPVGRDPERTPMRWTAEPNAGFCPPDATPSLPIGDDIADVATQREDPRSMLALHRRLLALRRSTDALAVGAYRTVHAGPGALAYLRGERVLVVLNLTGEPQRVPLGGLRGIRLLSTHLDGSDEPVGGGELRLREAEGVVAGLQ